ncbi:MAG TPA: hypothetical protein VNF49_11900 [Candidatus Binataceae bacterium]|nr:hypothetical protein [Candidatus Binataceae bacterium]
MRVLFVLAVVLLTGLRCGAAGAQTGSYQQGITDWRTLQAWFQTQTGDSRVGADYWAGNRSKVAHKSCDEASEGFSGDKSAFLAGCQGAKRLLDPIDVKRLSDAMYRAGFNYGAEELPISPGTSPQTRTPSPAPPATTENFDPSDPCTNPYAPAWQMPPWAMWNPMQRQLVLQHQQEMRIECEQKVRQRREAEIQQRAAAEQKEKYEQEVAHQIALDEQNGYHQMSVEDFVLDGKTLAASESKVAVKGIYMREGESELLLPSIEAAYALMQGQQPGQYIGLLTDDAARNIRKYFLDCDSNSHPSGCQITILGHATMCERKTLLGSTALPCIAVEDGWNFVQ